MVTATGEDAPVLLAVADGIATITLNRPAQGNAVDMATADALTAAAERCESDGAIRCVILTAAGKLFCGGGDIRAFAGAGDRLGEFLSALAGSANAACGRLMRMAKPLIVLVNGPAGGIGVSLAAIGDYVLCADTAHFTASYGAVGLTPDGGLSWTLPRLVGLRHAQRMLIGNERIGAEEAAAIGLVTRVVAGDRLVAEGAALAARLAAMPVAALGATRLLLLDGAVSDLPAQLAREGERIAEAGAGAEVQEGVAAFLARRPPDFRALPPA